jgi:hypothetical protein
MPAEPFVLGQSIRIRSKCQPRRKGKEGRVRNNVGQGWDVCHLEVESDKLPGTFCLFGIFRAKHCKTKQHIYGKVT